MRFEHDGMTLWYGTPDAPASADVVTAGAEIKVVIGVAPADASNRIDLVYRVNRGPEQKAAVRWLRNDSSSNAQYFEARLGRFRSGETVEYSVTCVCAGRRVPSAEDVDRAVSSLLVTEAETVEKTEEFSGKTKLFESSEGPKLSPVEPSPGIDSISKATPSSLLHGASKATSPGMLAGVENNGHRVDGRILLEHGQPAAGITVRLYTRGFGGADTRLGETKTDDQGHYKLPYKFSGKAVNFALRVVDAQGNEISLSATKFNADKHEVINLVAPTSIQPLAPEYQRLTADLVKHLGEIKKLAEARENGERQDLSILHQATGWDARLIALAATANKVSPETGISESALYALFRAGLPTDKEQLANVSTVAVEKALGKAKRAGIVSLTDQQITQVKAAFGKFARETRRVAKAPGALSSFGDLLSKSGLTDGEKNIFEDVYFTHRDAADELWQKARENGISEAKVNRLRLQGKLAYLTLNNADLAAGLQQEIGSPDNLPQLVAKDLYQPDAWKTRINASAGNNEEALKKLIPPAYEGEKIADRLDAYAADLARKVRLSFPTLVVGRMVEKDELRLGQDHDALKVSVSTFLHNAVALGFELGRLPVDAFINENREKIFQGIAPANVEATTQTIKKLQRLYQITPTDEALKVTADLGFTSAQEVVAFPYQAFLERFGNLFQTREEAVLVYRKAQQVSAVTFNLFTTAKAMDSAPAVYAISPPAVRREQAKNNLIKHYPTMESLFGSLDFCDCEHCRSVLSPAAYFVDLLKFLDPEESVWQEDLKAWKEKHDTAPYPFKDQSAWNDFLKDWRHNHPGQPDPNTEKKPYEILIERRPDLPHLPLTCENTHTALPYIDVVNEILEYYVANDELTHEAVHDTGDATTPELLAEPQNIIREAYDRLQQARYPLTLPFDLWLETVRRFFEHFETQLWQVLEIFRPTDELFPEPLNPKSYYRAAIFSEYLGISPGEYAIFSASNPRANWFELYGYVTEAEAVTEAHDNDGQRIDLNSAKALARRLGVSYTELVDLVRTGFINSRLNALVTLRKLGLDTVDVFRYKEHLGYPTYTSEERAAFETHLDELTESFRESEFNARTWLDTAWQNGDFNQILVLADPNAGCNFDQTILRYADGNPADTLVFLKINLFVRLWKKLGWTIEETDRALQVFLPRNSLPLTETNLGTALTTALVYLAHLEALNKRMKVGKNSRLKLLTFWSNLPTTGKNPLYSQLFLTRSVLKIDPVFDDPLGNYLSKAGILVNDHLLALQAALNLTADEVGRILVDDGKEFATAELSLNTVSALYRYGLLAKALKLSVRDLLALKRLSGLDPFEPLVPDVVATLANDHPFSQTLRFVEMAENVKESGFSVEDLEYLLRHRFDPIGKYRLNQEALLGLVKTLATEIRRIRTEHALPDDPATFTDDTLRQKLALALPVEVAETFLSMWTGSKEYESVYPDPVLPADKLDPEVFAQEPAISVSYNEARQEQRLTVRGVLLDGRKTELKTRFPSPLVGALLDAAQDQAKTFFKKHFEKSVAEEPFVGFLETAEFELLFAPVPPIPEDKPEAEKQTLREQNEEQMRQKRKRLAEAFLPFLQQKLTRQFIVQTLASSLSADLVVIEALLTRTDLLSDPSESGKQLLDVFIAASDQGFSATFFASTDGTGPQLIPPAGANSARFEGYLEVPTSGAYRFFVALGKKDAEAELCFEHLPDPLIREKAASDGAELSQFLELKAGVPYQYTLDARNLNGGGVSVLVLGENLPKGSLNRLTLYPQASIERIQRGWLLLAKTLQLIQGFGLSDREVRYLLTHATDFDGIDLGKLPTRDADDSPAAVTALFGQFLRLADYARLKRDVAGNTDDLISTFENARRTHPASFSAAQAETAVLDDLCKRIADLTRREVATVRATAEGLGFAAQSALIGNELRVEAPAFINEQGIWRLWEALRLVEKLGVSVDALERAATPAPDFAVARELKNTVKARYEPEAWQRIAQPIFDKLRQRQRDALAAYIMQRKDFKRLEQLFEYFLMDPGMQPVNTISRLRLAISSVQLFIQRCLLNLEPQVHPSAIQSNHWQWMKRYRVWEANRKIFLFPENWLEPEFRDDKTHLFQELESSLLQGDVSNDLVEDAFFNYLKKLEELARLDIITMYCEERADSDSNTIHVIGRTYNLPHKYFYRRYIREMWTPWEPVTAEIEGDHLAAVVWRERLHLFWVTFLEKPNPDANAQQNSSDTKELQAMTFDDITKRVSAAAPKKQVEVQLNWSEYFQGEWTTRESSGFGDPVRAEVDNDFDHRKVFIHVSKEYKGEREGAVTIHLGGAWDHIGASLDPFKGTTLIKTSPTFRVVSKNSPPEPSWGTSVRPQPYSNSQAQATQYMGSNALQVTFTERIETKEGKLERRVSATKEILKRGGDFSLLIRSNPIEFATAETEALVSPWFYQDDQHTFFVESTFSESTIRQWEHWVVSGSPADLKRNDDDWWENIPIEPEVPFPVGEGEPTPPESFYPLARFKIRLRKNWLTDPATVLKFDERLVGRSGGIELAVLRMATEHGVLSGNGSPRHEVILGDLIVNPGGHELNAGESPRRRLSVIDGSGLNSVALGNLNAGRDSNPAPELSNRFATSLLIR